MAHDVVDQDLSPVYEAISKKVEAQRGPAIIRVNPYAQDPEDRYTIDAVELVKRSGRVLGTHQSGNPLAAVGFVHRTLDTAEDLANRVKVVDDSPLIADVKDNTLTDESELVMASNVVTSSTVAGPARPAKMIGPVIFNLGQLGVISSWYDHVAIQGEDPCRYLILGYRTDEPRSVQLPPIQNATKAPIQVRIPNIANPLQVYNLGITHQYESMVFLLLPIVSASAPDVADAAALSGTMGDRSW